VTGGCAPYAYHLVERFDSDRGPFGPLGGGTYGVTVTDANGCTTTNSFTLTAACDSGQQRHVPATLQLRKQRVLQQARRMAASTSAATGGCAPYAYPLVARVPSTEDVSSTLGAGTYGVTVTDANGCTTTNSFTLTEPVILGIERHPRDFQLRLQCDLQRCHQRQHQPERDRRLRTLHLSLVERFDHRGS
jgi:hypothetical protein